MIFPLAFIRTRKTQINTQYILTNDLIKYGWCMHEIVKFIFVVRLIDEFSYFHY